jgi:arginine deiminase
MNTEINQAVKLFVKTLEQLNVPYYIGGSIASSVYGISRATMDVDLVSELKSVHVKFLVQALQNDYFIDENMILDAIKNKSSFNLIHLSTMIKIDVFISSERMFDKTSFSRRKQDKLSEELDSVQVFLCSAEDTILSKLEWYKSGGSVSDRQWKDILGVIKVQGELLDKDYLMEWAEELNVKELLEKALIEGKM